MTNYRPYNVLTPRPPVKRKATLAQMSAKTKLWLGVGMVILVLLLRIDLAQRAHAKAAEQAAYVRRTAAVKQLDQEFKKIAFDNPEIELSIATTDLNAGLVANYNSAIPTDAASTAKLLSAALYLNNIEKQSVKESGRIDGISVDKSLQRLIQQSDDVVWQKINDKLGHTALNYFAHGLDLRSYDASDNKISAYDMSLFLSQLYKGNLLNDKDTNKLLSFMQHTNSEDFIPPAADQGVVVYHKVGLNNDEVNDTAILKSGDDIFCLTIFTNGHGTYDWSGRSRLIQHITHLAQNAYLK